jgi:hypothetical protein
MQIIKSTSNFLKNSGNQTLNGTLQTNGLIQNFSGLSFIANNAIGTNIAGRSIAFEAGAATGTGNSGRIDFNSFNSGTSGSSTPSSTVALRIDSAPFASQASPIVLAGLIAKPTSDNILSGEVDNPAFATSFALFDTGIKARNFIRLHNTFAMGYIGGSDVPSGTTNGQAFELRIRSGAGTGNSTPSFIAFETPTITTSGTNYQSVSERMRIFGGGNIAIGTTTDDTVNRLQVSGSIKATQYRLNTLNTAPATSSSTGTVGEIRIDANFVYVCTGTNTWKRTALTTW